MKVTQAEQLLKRNAGGCCLRHVVLYVTAIYIIAETPSAQGPSYVAILLEPLDVPYQYVSISILLLYVATADLARSA